MDEYFVELAYKQALKSTMNKKYGAVLVYKKKVIGVGFNFSNRISNVNKIYIYEPNKYTVHAERACILNSNIRVFKNFTYMIIVKIVNNKPVIVGSCNMCYKLLDKYKLNRPVAALAEPRFADRTYRATK